MANTTGINESIACPNGFYFGDPCYALDEKLYSAWIEWGREREKTEGRWCNDGKFFHDGKEIMVVDSTAYGDGFYRGKLMSYGVDAGCLAAIPLEYCTKEGFEELGLVVRDYSGPVQFKTEGDTGLFLLDLGKDVNKKYEEVATGEDEDDEESEEEWEE